MLEQKNNWLHSKTSFTKGMQCVKQMYLHRHKRELLLETTHSQEKKRGLKFENKFRKRYFPNGIPMLENCNNNLNLNVKKTLELLNKEKEIAIFEAALIANNTIILCDVLHKNTSNTFDIYEIKNSKQLKSSFIWDAALQYYVCRSIFNEKLNTFNIVLNGRNNTYKTIEVSSQILKRIDKVENLLTQFSEILTYDEEPMIEMGRHCQNPYECAFMPYCIKTS